MWTVVAIKITIGHYLQAILLSRGLSLTQSHLGPFLDGSDGTDIISPIYKIREELENEF